MPNYEKLLGNGKDYGIKLSYAEQPSPDGLAQAFIIGEQFIGNDNCAMILGDNIFYGKNIKKVLQKAKLNINKATVFACYVKQPERFGIVYFNENNKVITIQEKPQVPKSNYAITGLYFYDNRVVEYAKSIQPSERGELEITDLNKLYLEQEDLEVIIIDNEIEWFDTGTVDSLISASESVRKVENEQNIIIASLEKIAYENGWIDINKLLDSAYKYGKSKYGEYLRYFVEKKENEKE